MENRIIDRKQRWNQMLVDERWPDLNYRQQQRSMKEDYIKQLSSLHINDYEILIDQPTIKNKIVCEIVGIFIPASTNA